MINFLKDYLLSNKWYIVVFVAGVMVGHVVFGVY